MRHRNLPLLLLQARESVIGRFRPILGAHGLTEQQWRIIRALLEEEKALGGAGGAGAGLEPHQIGTLCRISSPSLAGVLARMDSLGLVQRERLAEDQRRVRVSLTRKSLDLAAAMAPEIEATYAQIEEQVGAELLQRAYATLDELVRQLGQESTDGEQE
jgi:homoprotocatechuate degradation regulator HpaR